MRVVQTFPPSVLTQEKGKQVSTRRLVPTCAGRLQKTRVHQEVDGEANWNFPAAECRSAAEGLGDGCTLHQGNYPHTGLRDGARPRQHTVRSQVYGSPGPVSRPVEQPRCMDHQERQVAEGLPRKRRPHGDVSAMWTVPVDSRVHTGCQTVPSNVNDMSVKLLRKILEIVQVLFNLERLAAPAGSAGYSPASGAAVAVAAVKISKLYLSVKGSSNKPKAMSALFFPRSGRQDPEQEVPSEFKCPQSSCGERQPPWGRAEKAACRQDTQKDPLEKGRRASVGDFVTRALPGMVVLCPWLLAELLNPWDGSHLCYSSQVPLTPPELLLRG